MSSFRDLSLRNRLEFDNVTQFVPSNRRPVASPRDPGYMPIRWTLRTSRKATSGVEFEIRVYPSGFVPHKKSTRDSSLKANHVKTKNS